MPDNSPSTAEIFITKTEGARRQIDAAIRMLLLGEDDLAIYTVAAAANSVLRDLKSRRGRDALADLYGSSLFALALQIVDKKRSKYLQKLEAESPQHMWMVNQLAEKIRSTGSRDFRDVAITLPSSFVREHWGRVSGPANFLKHADRDARTAFAESDFSRHPEVILHAMSSYIDIARTPTSEMMAFMVYWAATIEEFEGLDQPWHDLAQEAARVDESFRRTECLELARDLKESGWPSALHGRKP